MVYPLALAPLHWPLHPWTKCINSRPALLQDLDFSTPHQLHRVWGRLPHFGYRGEGGVRMACSSCGKFRTSESRKLHHISILPHFWAHHFGQNENDTWETLDCVHTFFFSRYPLYPIYTCIPSFEDAESPLSLTSLSAQHSWRSLGETQMKEPTNPLNWS